MKAFCLEVAEAYADCTPHRGENKASFKKAGLECLTDGYLMSSSTKQTKVIFEAKSMAREKVSRKSPCKRLMRLSHQFSMALLWVSQRTGKIIMSSFHYAENIK